MKRASLAFLLSLAVPLAAQAPAGRHNTPMRNPGCLVHLTTRPWFTLDPAAAFDAVSFIATGNVYEPLIAFKNLKSTEEFIPFLATEVPTAANNLAAKDGSAYAFPIRKGVRFHEGQLLTPEDVRYSLLRFMLADPEGGPSSLLLRPILGVYSTRSPDGRITLDFAEAAKAVTVEGDNVVVRLKQPSSHFLKILASLPIVVSKEWAAAHGEWDGTEATWRRFNNRPVSSSYLDGHMNGTGPFELAGAESGKQLVFKRNDKYWRKPSSLAEVYLKVVPSPALRLSMLENGDADSSYLEDQDFDDASRIPEVRIEDDLPSTSSGQVLFFTFETDPASEGLGSGRLDGAGVPPDFFKDPAVRRGFAYAFDYEGFLKRGMGMRGKRAFSLVPGCLSPVKESPSYSYDPGKAKAEFKKAFNGQLWEKGFTLTIAYSLSDSSRQVIADLLRASLEKINPKFNLRTKILPSADLYAQAEKHRLPLFIAGYYADYPDPQAFAFGLVHSSGYFPKAQRYFNPKLDLLVEQAETAMDPGKRRELYRQIYRLANEDLPQIYTFQPTRFKAAREWVKGLQDDQNVSNLNLNNFPYFYALSKG